MNVRRRVYAYAVLATPKRVQDSDFQVDGRPSRLMFAKFE